MKRGELIRVPKSVRDWLYAEAVKRAEHKRRGWKGFDPQRFVGGTVDPTLDGYVRTVYNGFLGEAVIGYVLGIPIDLSLRPMLKWKACGRLAARSVEYAGPVL